MEFEDKNKMKKKLKRALKESEINEVFEIISKK
jgi:hypothetical protein